MNTCSICKTEFGDDIDSCPSCGTRMIIARDSRGMYDSIGIKGRRPGIKRPFLETRSGIRPDDRRPGKFINEDKTIRRDVPDGLYDHELEKLDEQAKPTGEPKHIEHETLKDHNEKKRARKEGNP